MTSHGQTIHGFVLPQMGEHIESEGAHEFKLSQINYIWAKYFFDICQTELPPTSGM